MSEILKPDRLSFPGGYDFTDLIVAVKLAAILHVDNAAFGATERAVRLQGAFNLALCKQ